MQAKLDKCEESELKTWKNDPMLDSRGECEWVWLLVSIAPLSPHSTVWCLEACTLKKQLVWYQFCSGHQPELIHIIKRGEDQLKSAGLAVMPPKWSSLLPWRSVRLSPSQRSAFFSYRACQLCAMAKKQQKMLDIFHCLFCLVLHFIHWVY